MILVMMIFPFAGFGFDWPMYLVAGRLEVNVKYIVAGVLFIIASLTDFLDGYLARKNKMVTDFGKVMDAIADKMLVNGMLVILAYDGFISVVIPVVIITRDIFVDSIKMAVGQKKGAVGASITGKIKTVSMLIGISLLLLYNLPFELFGLRIADGFIFVATIMSVISGIQYYNDNKRVLFDRDI